jgi:hypothetical protein
MGERLRTEIIGICVESLGLELVQVKDGGQDVVGLVWERRCLCSNLYAIGVFACVVADLEHATQTLRRPVPMENGHRCPDPQRSQLKSFVR